MLLKIVIYSCLISLCATLHPADFVLFTKPKTGTHLLIPILTELTERSVYWGKEFTHPVAHLNQVWENSKQRKAFLHLHAGHSAEIEDYLAQRDCINFFIKRDPRDQIVSLLNHYKYIHFNEAAVKEIPSDDERLLHMIRGRLRAETLRFMGWLQSPICCVLDFSKLMGNLGGAATDADALEEMRKIAKALGMKLSDTYLQRLYKKHLGKGWSFFKGKVGSWRDYFKEEHKAAVKEEIGDLLIELGYEKDLNW